MQYGIAGIAGGVEHLEIGPGLAQPVSQLASVHVRHHHIGEQQVDRQAILDQLHRLDRAVDIVHDEAQFDKAGARHRADPVIVLDHQHGEVLGRREAHGGLGAGLFLSGQLGRARQIELHRRALALFGIQVEVPARLLEETIDLAEAEAGALADILGGEEGIERTRLHLGRHADPGIADRDTDIIARRKVFLLTGIGRVERDIGRLDHQLAAIGHGVAGVDRQVDDRGFQLGLIDRARPDIAIELKFHDDLFAQRPFEQRVDRSDKRVDIQPARVERLLARIGKQPVRQRCGAVGGIGCIVDMADDPGIALAAQPPLGQIERAGDDCQHIVEVMRDAAGKMPDRIELFRLVQPGLGNLALCDLLFQLRGAFCHQIVQPGIQPSQFLGHRQPIVMRAEHAFDD